MKICIDADACPVTRIVERVAREHGIPVVLLCDTNHLLSSDTSEIRVVGAGADAVDIALINLCRKGDIVVTQDYGVAALALGKGAKAIHQSGRWYTDDNIDALLMERHMAKVARRKSKNHLKGPAKRTEEDDRRFEESFRRLLESLPQNLKQQRNGGCGDEKPRSHPGAGPVGCPGQPGGAGLVAPTGAEVRQEPDQGPEVAHQGVGLLPGDGQELCRGVHDL